MMIEPMRSGLILLPLISERVLMKSSISRILVFLFLLCVSGNIYSTYKNCENKPNFVGKF